MNAGQDAERAISRSLSRRTRVRRRRRWISPDTRRRSSCSRCGPKPISKRRLPAPRLTRRRRREAEFARIRSEADALREAAVREARAGGCRGTGGDRGRDRLCTPRRAMQVLEEELARTRGEAERARVAERERLKRAPSGAWRRRAGCAQCGRDSAARSLEAEVARVRAEATRDSPPRSSVCGVKASRYSPQRSKRSSRPSGAAKTRQRMCSRPRSHACGARRTRSSKRSWRASAARRRSRGWH